MYGLKTRIAIGVIGLVVFAAAFVSIQALLPLYPGIWPVLVLGPIGAVIGLYMTLVVIFQWRAFLAWAAPIRPEGDLGDGRS